MSVFRDYVCIARPDHWIKNVFMLPGLVYSDILSGQTILNNAPRWSEASSVIV